MKKFMKAIAFVTVMCLAFSTVAFAAGNAVLDEDAEKVLNITVTGAGEDQVSLVVVASDAEDYDFSDPLYVDQTASVNDEASFTAVLTNADVDAVDIYVGYSTYAATNARPEKIGNDISLKPITEVSIVKFNSGFGTNHVNAEGTKTATGVWAELEVKAPKGVSASQVVWAIRYTDGTSDEKVKYSDAYDVSGYGIGSAMEGPVKFALTFLNGSSVTITKVDAIFLFTDGEEVLTNEEDAINEHPNNNNK